MDRGLWITWYNLPAQGRDAHLAWLHGTYIPKILKKPGVLWAAHYISDKVPPQPALRHTSDPAVPAGNDYFLLFGGETAHVFSSGTAPYVSGGAGRFDADLTAEDRKMLAMREGERVCITAEVARRDGPEANRREGEFAPTACIQLGTFNIESIEAENEMLAWYADWRLPALGKLPGCVAIRELVSVSGWAKHGILYEFVSREARDAHFPKLKDIYPAEGGVWSPKAVVKLMHAPDSPVIGTRIWPPIK